MDKGLSLFLSGPHLRSTSGWVTLRPKHPLKQLS